MAEYEQETQKIFLQILKVYTAGFTNVENYNLHVKQQSEKSSMATLTMKPALQKNDESNNKTKESITIDITRKDDVKMNSDNKEDPTK